jgi:NADPH2:quinone reductase
MQNHAIRIHEFGGPDVLRWESVDIPALASNEARIRHTAIGLNFIDTYHRTGLYPMELPGGLGSEAAGIVEAIGTSVTEVAVGDRVVYTGQPAQAYSEVRNFPANRLVRIPETLSDEQAAAVFLKGLTAWYLLRRSYVVKPGDPILLYAAAGGVGSLASQWANQLGAEIIGVVSTAEKADLAMAQGCSHILMADDPDIPGKVKALTNDAGVAAVYDSVGRDTFTTSLDCLRPHGTMVTFGNASGPVEPFAAAELANRGSLYLTRPILYDFIRSRDDLLAASTELFDFLASSDVQILIGQRYPLKNAAEAHRDLEARKTKGASILLPG